jgi:hypothetical protein
VKDCSNPTLLLVNPMSCSAGEGKGSIKSLAFKIGGVSLRDTGALSRLGERRCALFSLGFAWREVCTLHSQERSRKDRSSSISTRSEDGTL